MPKQRIYASVDRDRFMQVMINLISNAVKFCDIKLGKIKISLTHESDKIRVVVKDNGIGISPDNQEIIFKEFLQIKDPSRGRPFGTGVGLSITKHIVDAHNGRIWVESELGKGAAFIFTLPINHVSNPKKNDSL